MFDDYTRFDGLGLAELIARGDVSATEVLEAAIHQAQTRDPDINAIVTKLYDHGRARLHKPLSGPFAGVPFLLKDAHHALAGTPMSNGSRLHKGEVSACDAEIVRRFLDAGLVVFGKTNTPEYKLSSHTICEAWGATRNPWDVTRSAYGSSGGSAAAVAAGIVPMASGTDEGGSIRLPASACGVFGLKPSRGRNPMGPDFRWELGGLSTSHVVTRTVRDCAAMLDVTAGPEPGSPYTAPGEGGFLTALERDPGRLRVGLSTERAAYGRPMDPACVEATVAAGRVLEDLGHAVEEVSLPYDEGEVLRTWATVAVTDTAALITDLEARYGRRRVKRSLEDIILVLANIGRALPAEDAARARRACLGVGAALGDFFRTYDVLVLPTMGRVPIPLAAAELAPKDQRALRLLASPAGARLLRAGPVRDAVTDAQSEQYTEQVMQRTMVANLAGTPAMSVPLHRSDDGLPVGVQFLGRFGDEVTLLRLAAQLETAKPWSMPS